MNSKELDALDERARKYAKEHELKARNCAWMLAADFAVRELNRERRRAKKQEGTR